MPLYEGASLLGQSLHTYHIVELDLSSLESIRAAAAKTAELLPDGLDHLISNAGIFTVGFASFEDMYV